MEDRIDYVLITIEDPFPDDSGGIEILERNFDEEGNVVVEHSPKVKVFANCKGWGYHVWGNKAYSLLYDCPKNLKLVIVKGPLRFEVFENEWITIAYSRREYVPRPWSPVSVFVETSKVMSVVREGMLMIVPSLR